ncbi:hypothetical protein ABPG77_005121 [Micractinium sp. CCAP 211/92]
MDWAAQSPSGGQRLSGGVQGDPTTPQGQLLQPAAHPPGAPRKSKPPCSRRLLSLSSGAPVRRLNFDGIAVQLGPSAEAHVVPATEPPVSASPPSAAAALSCLGGGTGAVRACSPPAARPIKPSKLQRIR